MKRRTIATAYVLLGLALMASAENVTIEVTNQQHSGGFTFSPPWVAFHPGTFDTFDNGSAASPEIEAVAELGDGSGLTALLGADGVAAIVPSPADPPPFTPGESGSLLMDIGDPMVNRYFSFASMLVPSNDFFLGNDDPLAYEVFDAAGNFLGPITVLIFSDDAWDAGTEVNDLANGPAFIVGQDATLGAAEDGVVQPLYSVAGVDAYLASIVGMETPIGTITDPLAPGQLVATIRIIPEPGSLVALALLGLAALRRR